MEEVYRMSSEKTPNLGLHTWVPEDYVQMEEFNENFKKLDEVGGAADQLSTDVETISIQLEQTVKKEDYTQEMNSVTAQLADTVNKNPIYLSDYGISVTKTATENNAIISQAIIDAEYGNRPIIFPWTAQGLFIEVSKRFIINAPIDIYGFGANTCIRHNFSTSVSNGSNTLFDLRASGASVHDIAIYGKTGNEGGILICADNARAERIKIVNLTHGIRVMAYDFNNAIRKAPKNVTVDDILSDQCCFPLLVEGSIDLNFNNIRGSYKIIGSRSPHLVYFSDGRNTVLTDITIPLAENINPIGGNCLATDGSTSYAYQIKYVRGGNIRDLHARNSKGLLNILESSSFNIKDISSLDDTNVEFGYGTIDIDGICTDIVIDNVRITNDVNGKILRMGPNTSNITVKNLDASVAHTSTPSNDYYPVQLYGNSHKLINPKIINKNVNYPWFASIGVYTGNGHIIDNPQTEGDSIGVVIRGTGSGNKLVNYDMDSIKFVTGKGYSKAVEVVASDTSLHPKLSQSVASDKGRMLAYDRADKKNGSALTPTATTSGHNWIIGFGTWQIVDERLVSTVGSNANIYITLPTPNVEISAGVKVANREAILVRVIDRLNYLGIRLNQITNTLDIFKRVNGAVTDLITTAFTVQVGRRYKLKLQIYGNRLDAYVDDVHYLTHTLSVEDVTFFASAVMTGVQGNGDAAGKFDNVEWKSLE